MLRAWRTGTAFLFVALISAALAFSASGASASAPVETFVQNNVDVGVKILGDASKSDAERHTQFREFLLRLMDMKRIAMFTLGSWRKNAAQADLDQFADAFRQFAIANYDARIGGYSGQTLKVMSSRENAKDDYVVTAKVLNPEDNGKAGPNALEVSLRVLNENGKFAVVDASVEGIWLAVTQRDDFNGYLSQHNGDIKALSERVREHAAQLTNATPSN
jgi:phospholipid transport system substrate-binding protein